MASNTKLGSQMGKRKLPPALMIVMGPKGGPDTPPPDSGEPDADDMPSTKSAPDSTPTPDGAPKVGESVFHDQRQLCSNCSHFDADGADGVGECMMHVPEADFTISDPDASHCKFWGAQDQRSSQSADQTGVPTPPPMPPAA